jgi:hypothetical protein
MTIIEKNLTRSGHIKAVFNNETLKLEDAVHYNGRSTRDLKPGGVLWSKLQRAARRYLYERNR